MEADAPEVEVVDVVPGGSGAAGHATGRRLSRLNFHFKECGFASGNAVAAAREDTIIAAVFEDSKQDAPAYLADKKLGAPTGGLETAWTRVQALVDAAEMVHRNEANTKFFPVVAMLFWLKTLKANGIEDGPLIPALNNAHDDFLRSEVDGEMHLSTRPYRLVDLIFMVTMVR